MKAVVWHGIGDIRLDDVPEPALRDPHDAIVRITRSAICGTDLHMVRGTMPGMREGTVLGHEAVGVVTEVGDAVRGFSPGDRVLVNSTISCGACRYCRMGRTAQCDVANPNGPQAGTSFFGGPETTGPVDGLQAEYARIPWAQNTMHPLPDTVSDEQAILLSDIFPTGWFGAELAGVRRGDVVAAGEMTYPGLKAIAIQKGLILEPLAMDGHGILPDAFEKACRERSPKALYLTPTIDNPTTATMPEDRRRKIAALAQQHGVAVIEDDPYAPLRPDRIVTIAALAGAITWHIATLSKCATPALRVAYVVAPNAAKALRLAGALRATILMAPPLMSALASRWIADGTLDEIIRAIRAENVERQKLAAAILGDAAYAADPHGHHLWLRLPGQWHAADFAEHADRAGVSIVPSSVFSVAAHPSEAVRLSLGIAPDRGTLEDGLSQLASFLSQPSVAARTMV